MDSSDSEDKQMYTATLDEEDDIPANVPQYLVKKEFDEMLNCTRSLAQLDIAPV